MTMKIYGDDYYAIITTIKILMTSYLAIVGLPYQLDKIIEIVLKRIIEEWGFCRRNRKKLYEVLDFLEKNNIDNRLDIMERFPYERNFWKTSSNKKYVQLEVY